MSPLELERMTHHSKLVSRTEPERQGLLDNSPGGPRISMRRRVYNPLHAIQLRIVSGALMIAGSFVEVTYRLLPIVVPSF